MKSFEIESLAVGWKENLNNETIFHAHLFSIGYL